MHGNTNIKKLKQISNMIGAVQCKKDKIIYHTHIRHLAEPGESDVTVGFPSVR